jgi:hypothetical protein
MQFTRKRFLTVLILFILTSLPIFAQQFVYVSVEKAELKEGTGFFANKVSEADYGTKLLVLENSIEDKWIKVTEEGNQTVAGWILTSNVTKRKVINLLDKTKTSGKEIALAGKGFSEGKVNSGKTNYQALDKIENSAKNLDTEKLKSFIQNGNLKGE